MHYCNQETKEKIFHPSVLELNMDRYIPWKPFQWKHSIPPTDGIPQDIPVKYHQRSENSNNKKTRHNHIVLPHKINPSNIIIPTIPNSSYASAAANQFSPQSDITTMTKTTGANSNHWSDINTEVENIPRKCEEMQLSHTEQLRSMQEMERRLENSIDQKLSDHAETTQTNIMKLMAEAEEKSNSTQNVLFENIGRLISQSVMDSIAVAMEKYESTKPPGYTTDIEMMDTSGTDILPQKRRDMSTEGIKQKNKTPINAGNKTIDWKQRKLG